jgi:hypothetical protein
VFDHERLSVSKLTASEDSDLDLSFLYRRHRACLVLSPLWTTKSISPSCNYTHPDLQRGDFAFLEKYKCRREYIFIALFILQPLRGISSYARTSSSIHRDALSSTSKVTQTTKNTLLMALATFQGIKRPIQHRHGYIVVSSGKPWAGSGIRYTSLSGTLSSSSWLFLCGWPRILIFAWLQYTHFSSHRVVT